MGFLDIIAGLVKPIIGNIFPNPEDELKRQQMEMQFKTALMEKQADLQLAAADIVKTEAASTHWLTACWRPILMLTFGALVVARCLGVNNPAMSPDEYSHLWTLLEIGIGGYVVGRSAEKITDTLTKKPNEK